MERTYRTSKGLYVYAGLLLLTAALLAFEAFQRFRAGATGWSIFLATLALIWVVVAAYLLARWGKMRVVVRSDSITIRGDGPDRTIEWAEVIRLRELRGPAYQLSVRGLLPGPYLPLGLLRGETVLEIVGRPATRLVIRQALVDGYGALRQDVVGSVPRDASVDLHARWWRPWGAGADSDSAQTGGEADDADVARDENEVPDDDEIERDAVRRIASRGGRYQLGR